MNRNGGNEMQRKVKSIIVIVSAVMLLIFSLSFSAMAQDRGPSKGDGVPLGQITKGEGVVSVSSTVEQAGAALSFWTKDRLAAATPLDIYAQTGPATIDAAAVEMAVSGPPGYSAGGAPIANADMLARAAYPQEWAEFDRAVLDTLDIYAIDSPAAEDGTSQIFTSYTINQQAAVQKNFPHRVSGRLSFTTPSGTSYCSASVVSPNNIIVTAAHCIYDTPSRNQFYTNIVFTPAYRAGNAPYGTYPFQTCWVLNSWVGLSGSYSINTWADDDVAVCRMRNNSAGQSLSNMVGWFGRGWDWGYVQHFHTLGYPFRNTSDALLTNAGAYLRSCQSESFQQATNVVGTGCNLSRGHSGGPFVVGYSLAAVSGQVRSVYSGFFIGTQNAYGARFNSNNIVPLCTAAGC
ncbi:MAG: trypsin-like serine protease [Chloroflexota bacterium]